MEVGLLDKRLLGVALVALGLVFGLGTSTVIAQQTYRNEEYGFSIEPPSGWTVDESAWGAVAFLGPRENGFTVNVTIAVEDVPQEMGLDEYVSAGKQDLSKLLTTYQIVSEGSRVIGGLNAYELVVTGTIGVFEPKAKVVTLLKDGKAYEICFMALQSNYLSFPAFYHYSTKKDGPKYRFL